MLKLGSNSTEKLSSTQLVIIKELVDDALRKAVDSMERMLKIPLKIDYTDYGNGPLMRIPEFDNLGRFKVHIIKAVFKGDVNGGIYLAINGHEVDQLTRACLPAKLHSENSSASKMMKLGFIVEIENMIAAQVVSEIADFLGVELISDVPTVDVIKGSSVNDYFKNENEILQTSFHVKTVMASKISVDISPFFIWMLDQRFVSNLRLNIVT
jgi:hypothetical protein